MKAIARKPYPEYVRLEARRLRSREGLSYPTIAKRLSVPQTTIYRWCNPHYAEQSRHDSLEAKRRRVGKCEDCGAETHYNGGTSDKSDFRGASRFCLPCTNIRTAADRTFWTRDRIVAAIRWWANLYGKQPAQADFNPTQATYQGDYRRAVRAERHIAAREIPWFTSVSKEFGSWNAGIKAAGFQPLASHGGSGNELRRRKVAA